MKRLSAILLLATSLAANAQTTMREAFIQMPDSIVPYLSHSNCLDLIDYYDAKMKAEVTNELGGSSELLALTADSLSLRLNGQHRIDALIVDTQEAVDSVERVIVVGHTYTLTTGEYERTYHLFSLSWRPLTQSPAMTQKQRERLLQFTGSTLLMRDDEVFKKLR